jgi:hypothetical protein
MVRSGHLADPGKSTTHATHVLAIFPNTKDFINYVATMKIAVFATLLATASAFSINKADFAKVRVFIVMKDGQVLRPLQQLDPFDFLKDGLTPLSEADLSLPWDSLRGCTNFFVHLTAISQTCFLGCHRWSPRLRTCPATRCCRRCW